MAEKPTPAETLNSNAGQSPTSELKTGYSSGTTGTYIYTTAPGTAGTGGQESPSIPQDVLDKLAQSAEDKMRTKYSKQIKNLETELDTLRKEKMSDEERKALEQQRYAEALSQKEKELLEKEIAIEARDQLIAEGMPLSFVDYVRGGTIEETRTRVKKMKAEFSKALGEAVDVQMKNAGRDPRKERDASTGTPSAVESMSPEEIEKRSRADPKWYHEHEIEILAAVASGKIKKK